MKDINECPYCGKDISDFIIEIIKRSDGIYGILDCPCCGRDIFNFVINKVTNVNKDINEKEDIVNHPPHYKNRVVECIDITEDMNFCLGNAMKYIWRADYKGKAIEDLEKARWYIDREIKRRKKKGE